MFHDPHNTFRPNDAFEFTDAYRAAVLESPETIRGRLHNLIARMDRVEATGQAVPSYMLAAYRAYEAALCWVEHRVLPGVVKLDDLDPTRCEIMDPQGYAHR